MVSAWLVTLILFLVLLLRHLLRRSEETLQSFNTAKFLEHTGENWVSDEPLTELEGEKDAEEDARDK
jgi:hypothetical protein